MASWTEKCVDRLKLLHEEGFSATVIAKKLGPDFTKGMVLGKLRRLALAEAPEAQETRKASVQRVIPSKEVPAGRLDPPSSRIVLPAFTRPNRPTLLLVVLIVRLVTAWPSRAR